jgi:hypothetical protein
MNETATDLERAHARIAMLERALASAPDAPTGRPWAESGRWCALALAILLIAGALSVVIVPGFEIVVRAPPPLPPTPIPAGDLEVFSPGFVWDTDGPALVDVEDQGSAHDLLVLAWRAGHPDRPMHVVALRRGSYEVLWRSEGFPSSRRNKAVSLAAIGGRVALSDARGVVHVLDVHTGHELRAIPRSPSERLATTASDPNAVFAIDSGIVLADSEARRIDLVTGQESESSLPSRSLLRECKVERSQACRAEPLPATKAQLRRLVSEPAAEFGEDLVDADTGDRITVYNTAPRPQLVAFQLFAWNPEGNVLKWKAPAVPKSRQALAGAGSGTDNWLALANHRVVAIYLVGSAGHRAAAHDVPTGKLTYDVALPELPYGIEVERLTLDGDTGFIVTTGALFVLDAASGKVTKALRRF